MYFLSVVWNPSIGIDLGFFTIRWYSLMFVAAFLLGLYLMKKIFINDNIDVKQLDLIFMYTFFPMLIGMRLGEVFFYNWDHYKDHWLEIILPFRERAGETTLFGLIDGWEFVGYTGFASHGAAIAIILGMYFYNKKHLKKSMLYILDRLVIVVALGGAFVRLGNFFNSEIYGKETGSNFGVIFRAAKETVPRHPTQLYEAFSYLILFFTLWRIYWKTDKKHHVGFIFGIFMIALWSLRFAIEFLKEAQVDGREDWVFNSLNTGQVLSIPLVMVGLWLVLRKKKQLTS